MMLHREKNTAQLWNTIWENDHSFVDFDDYSLLKEEYGIRWQRMEKIICKEFGGFKDLHVIEIGSGTGKHACLMAKRGATVSLLDYSEKALEQAKELFLKNNVSAEYILGNALQIPEKLSGKFDVSISFGLTEHFTGQDRIQINRSHFEVLKKGGMAFISVPNRYNPPYRIYKFISEITGYWKVGEEIPYSRREFKRICRKEGIADYFFIGDSFFDSFRFINPVIILKKFLKRKKAYNIDRLRKEKGSLLDQYFSYALVLCGRKGSILSKRQSS